MADELFNQMIWTVRDRGVAMGYRLTVHDCVFIAMGLRRPPVLTIDEHIRRVFEGNPRRDSNPQSSA